MNRDLIGGKKIWIKNVNAAQITVMNALNVEDTIFIHSPHYESYYKREVVNITCFFGEAGTYDAETRQRLSTI